MTCVSSERLETPVIEDQDADAAEGTEQTAIATVAAGHGEISEQFGDTLVEDGAIVTAGLVAKHLPYVDEWDWLGPDPIPLEQAIKLSVARCARVSYLTHEGKTPTVEADLALYASARLAS